MTHSRGHYYHLQQLKREGKPYVEPVHAFFVYVPFEAKSFAIEYAPRERG